MRKSVLYVFLASVCFSTGGLFIKLIPWSPLAINGARNLIGAAVIGVYLLLGRHRLVFSRPVFIGAAAMAGIIHTYHASATELKKAPTPRHVKRASGRGSDFFRSRRIPIPNASSHPAI